MTAATSRRYGFYAMSVQPDLEQATDSLSGSQTYQTSAVSAAEPPAGVDASPKQSPGGYLNWIAWASPAICEVLADHTAAVPPGDVLVHCQGIDSACHNHFGDWGAWREHVAELIAERLQSAAFDELMRHDQGVTGAMWRFIHNK